MGFVVGGGNIAIVTALGCYTHYFLYRIVSNHTVYGYQSSSLSRVPEASVSGCGETNPGPRRPAHAVYTILCTNMQGLSRNLSDLTVASSPFDILLCSETMVSDICHVLELLVPGFGRPVVVCWGRMPQAREMGAYVRD